ncbi:hypothetical protein IFM89_027437 [Coptis chinensis]|uniref:(S)-ureidoglycine aminohydrolase cupin domain-containing protein n=1 Tax=Coptis chinensis TaxID=261450 RepID=A0A835MAT8_9MAGN|nr:hypothetical protein IFM89_027437 [Coptis chinensis]
MFWSSGCSSFFEFGYFFTNFLRFDAWDGAHGFIDSVFGSDRSITRHMGKVKVYPDGHNEFVEFGAGDLVEFPKGMSYTWDVSETGQALQIRVEQYQKSLYSLNS